MARRVPQPVNPGQETPWGKQPREIRALSDKQKYSGKSPIDSEALCKQVDEQVRTMEPISLSTQTAEEIQRLNPERDGSGSVSAVPTASSDITAHRHVEQEYETLFTEMLEGFALHEIICNAEGCCLSH